MELCLRTDVAEQLQHLLCSKEESVTTSRALTLSFWSLGESNCPGFKIEYIFEVYKIFLVLADGDLGGVLLTVGMYVFT